MEIKPYDAKVVKNGNSLQVLIPAHIRKFVTINEGDQIEVSLKLVQRNGSVRILPQDLAIIKNVSAAKAFESFIHETPPFHNEVCAIGRAFS